MGHKGKWMAVHHAECFGVCAPNTWRNQKLAWCSMSAEAVIQQAEELGITLTLYGDTIRYQPKSAASTGFVDELRKHKAELMAALLEQPICGNSLTPHEKHEHRWECDPNSCTCYRMFGEPFWCGGIPCRWTFPRT